MNHADERKWAKLIFVYRKHYVSLHYEDGHGHSVRTDGKNFRIENAFRIRPLRVPEIIESYLQEVINAEPLQRQTVDGPKPIPLALFIEHDLPDPLRLLVHSELLNYHYRTIPALFPGVLTSENHQVVNFVTEPAQLAFKLPFNIRFAGDLAEEMITVLNEKNWFHRHATVETHGITLKTIKDLASYEEDGVDILVISDYPTYDLLSQENHLKLKPGLVIVLANYFRYPDHVDRTSLFLPVYSTEETRKFLEDFFYSIIHDFPLHESFQFAKRQLPFYAETALFASPASNHSLRISAGLESFKSEVNYYNNVVNPGKLDQFITKLETGSEFKFSKTISDAFTTSMGDIPAYFNNIRDYGNNFNQETSGLVPLSYERGNFKNYVQPEFEQVRSRLKSIVNTPGMFKILRDHQERKVDVTLDFLNPSLIYLPLQKTTALGAGKQYRLNVAIGQPSPNSLMVGNVGAIDPLLPDPDDARGHELEIVVFQKDFVLLSEASRKVYLPLLGGTEPAHFIIKAPDEKKQAELRIGIFYKNNLMQAFLLQAEVRSEEAYLQKQSVQVTMDLSNSERFTNIDEIKKRNLYIGFNSNGEGSHTLFVKNDNVVEEIRGLSDALIDKAQQEFKTLLKQAYFDATGAIRFSSYAEPGSALTEEFKTEIRKFARFGEKYVNQLFDSASEQLQDEFSQLRDKHDQEIQIGRHDPNYSFPWAVLYDYIAPPNTYGEEDYPICMGAPFGEHEHASYKKQKGFGCPHNPDTHCFCIEGFWGIRHRIEQIFKNSEARDAKSAVRVTQDSKIYFTCNTEDNDAVELAKDLLTHKPAVETVTPEVDLMETLWDEQKRPIMLIVLGHLQTTPEKGEPNEPRIRMFAKNKWTLSSPMPQDKFICYSVLSRYYKTKKRWKTEPFPIVLLINCDVAQMDVRSLNSIVTAFNSAGAGAVIGTEANITSGLAARFVREILNGLYKQKIPLGRAIQLFNQNLARSGNPLAFIFTCYGNINLKIVN